MTRPLRVAIIGAGPAGIYAADLLTKAERDFDVSIDLFERLPAPFGLVRYGVAPDHPRIKGIINALIKVLDRGDIRLFANVEYGTDITREELQRHYDAVIFSTGCFIDAKLDIPGVDLDRSYGAADFVNWYDAHPDVPQTWPLDAERVAVIGNGNVALDVARVLAKQADDMLSTEIPDHVYEGLKQSRVTDVHVFGRRGPAQAKFTPLELRELGHVKDVDIIVYPEDFEFDEASMATIHSNNQVKQVTKTLTDFTLREPTGAPRRLHLHFLHAPVAVLGDTGVTGLRTERQELDGSGDALETITHLIADRAAGGLPEPEAPTEDAIIELLRSKSVDFVDWEGYHLLEAAEMALGEPHGRERIKIATREAMLAEARRAVVAADETVG